MSRYQIAVVVGSLRKDSFNRKLADALVKLAPPEVSFKQMQISDLPLYNQDDDANQADSVKRLKSEVRAAHALLFVTAEYSRWIPGVLKNALDHASRPCGQNAWAGKPAGVLGASVGAIGAAMAQRHLRNVLAYLDDNAYGNIVNRDYDGSDPHHTKSQPRQRTLVGRRHYLSRMPGQS
jgi:chromate reductase, NAD(P)H dehydrogenase (quinone)